MSRKRCSSEEAALMNDIGLSQSTNAGSDASVSSVDDSNLSDDLVRFDEEVKENSSSDEEILLPRGPLVRRQAKMRGGSSAKKSRTRGRGVLL